MKFGAIRMWENIILRTSGSKNTNPMVFIHYNIKNKVITYNITISNYWKLNFKQNSEMNNFCYLQRAVSDIWIRLNMRNKFTVIFTTLDVMFLLFKLFRFWHWPLMTLVEITALISIVVILLVDYICVFKNNSTCFE